jgi:hypothetical protein
VTKKAGAFAEGLKSGGVNPVYKHFPGLGSTSGNSDSGSVTSPSLSTLKAKDLKPYETLANKNGGAVMLDNAHVPGLTDANEVASISSEAVKLLRSDYNFKGLITTDDLAAKGVPASLPAAISKSLKAGVDMPLFAYTNDSDIDSAISSAKSAGVNTNDSLQRISDFVGSTSSQPDSSSQTVGCCPAGGSTQLSGKGNAEKVWNFFIGLGLSNYQVAGIMGNLEIESNFEPTAMYPSTHGTDPTVDVAWGLGQWTEGKVVGIQQKSGVAGDITLLETQLNIMKWEIDHQTPTGYQHFIDDYKKLVVTKADVAKGVAFWQRYYEGSSGQADAKRVAAGIAWANKPGGGAGSNAASTADASGPGDSCSSTGAASAGDGEVEVAAGANKPGLDITDVAMDFFKKAAGIYGKKLICTTGTNHDQYTADGNVSDHYSGNACDFGMVANGGTDDGPVGNAIMTACLEAAGDSHDDAVKTAEIRNGPVQDRTSGGLRVQCIWGTNAGGNHHNHVHMGVKKV